MNMQACNNRTLRQERKYAINESKSEKIFTGIFNIHYTY